MNIKLRSSIGFFLLSLFLVGCSTGEGGSEGNDGPGGDGAAGGGFVSNGISNGVFTTIEVLPDERFAGRAGLTEIAFSYDATNDRFDGRIRNEAQAAVCDVGVLVTLDQSVTGNVLQIPGLTPRSGAEFQFPLFGSRFASATFQVETSGCSMAPTGTGGGDGDGGGGGDGNDGGGGDGAGGVLTPINMRFFGTFQMSDFDFGYNAARDAFEGTVTNPTANIICASRTEIHVGTGASTLELGPTIPQDLQAGEVIKVVLSPDGNVMDMYSLHPESSPCP